MFKNYLKVAFRNLLRFKVFSTINIIGLAVGMAASIIILRYVQYEMNYETFNPKADNIYRIRADKYQNKALQFKSARSYPGLTRLITAEIPEISLAARVYPEECLFKYNDKKISGQSVLWVDDPFLEMFSLRMLKSVSAHPLKNTFSSVISSSAAKRFFGGEDPIGKIITLNEGVNFIINGVFEDYPEDTHLRADFLLSMNTIGALDGEHVIEMIEYNWLYTYVMLRPGASADLTEKKLAQTVDRHFTYLKDSNSKIDLFLQPVKDIHLKSDLSEEIAPNSNTKIVYFLLLIAAVILLMAWINFINLSTSRALERAKEVGMRKVVGANRAQIIKQFIFESTLVNLAAFLIAIAAVEMLRPVVNELISQKLSVSIFSVPVFWLEILAVFLVCGVIAGFYPALLLSSFNPAVIIKGKFRNSGKGAVIRKSLVVFQFSAAIALITGTLIISRQIDFVQHQYLGFNAEQVLVVKTPRTLINNNGRVIKFERFREILVNYPAVKYVSAADAIPGREIVSHIDNFTRLGAEPKNISFSAVNVDRDYFKLLEMKFAAGRGFLKEFISDSAAVVINETASAMFGFASPSEATGNYIADLTGRSKFKVIGVAADHHQEHFKKSLEPIIYFQGHRYQFGYFPIRVNTKNLAETISQINNVWSGIYPADPCDYFFLDEFFNAQYKADLQFGRTIMVFSVLAIIIASLGLFGLSALSAVQRTKEIGIRKTLGASPLSLIYQLSRDFLMLILVSNLIAWPVIYYIMNEWLNTFTERISLNILYFLLPGLIIVIMASATIAWQVIKVTKLNPVESLKYE